MSKKLVLAMVTMLLSCGCNREPQTVDTSGGAPRQVEGASELVAMARPPIADLPIPIGFTLDEGKSRNFAAAGARYVDHVYKGSSDKFAVSRFYRRQMPINGWTSVTEIFSEGQAVLDFEKETERCRVILNETGMFNHTEIKVQLWTSGRIETKHGPGKQLGS